jgi:hypothetical protein
MMRRTTDKIVVVCATVSILCFVGVAAVSGTVLDQNRELRSTTQRLEEASMGVCMRLQSQRDRANLSDARQFLILRQVLRSPRLTPQARRQYRQYVASTEYGPRTDCAKAVDDPPSFRPPGFVPFTVLGARFAQALLDAAEAKQRPPVPTTR